MRLTAILLFSACLSASAKMDAQGISLSLKEVPIEKVFQEIKKQSGMQVLYTRSMIKDAAKVSVDIKNASLETALQEILKNQKLGYTIINNTIVIKERETAPNGDGHSGLDPESFSQLPPPIDISGKVTDENGNPLVGASVKVKGSSKGTTTNSDGVFTLKGVSDDAVLEISYVGFELLNVPVNNRIAIVTSLKPKPESLGEVVINKGYYTEKQRNSVGNVATVTAKDIERQPIQNPLLALQGRVAGLEVNQLTGLPGGGVQVRIQGVNSINSGRDPLIVIDGVPYPTQFQNSVAYETPVLQGGSPLNFINPNDIEAIDVLKDADATAIYGSRASNGAILITTKKGKTGKMKVDINMQQGWSKVARKVDMMNTRQYLDMRYEALRNDNIPLASLNQSANYDLTVWDTTRYTDWQKELLGGTARYTNINASISGGGASVQYLISGIYNKQTNIFSSDYGDQRGALHTSITANSKDQKLKIQFSGNYMYDNNQLMRNDLTQFALLTSPNAPALFNADGSLNWAPNAAGASTLANPLAKLFYQKFTETTQNLVNNMRLDYRILPGLELGTSVGYTSILSSMYLPIYKESVKPESRATTDRQTDNSERNMNSWIFEPQLQYSKNISKGMLDALVGGTILRNRAKTISVTSTGYPNDLLMQTLGAATSISGSSVATESNFNSLFSRLNYRWDNKYIVNLTARRDASSKFGDANKLHDFASVGLGWIFSDEACINKNPGFLSYGKLRGSYGTTGNDQFQDDFGYLSIYSIQRPGILYQSGINVQVTRLPNPHLQWEETRKLQAGIDLGFIKDRILLSATYVRNRSSNQLVSYTLPSTTGFTKITQNLPALIQNKNWEFTLNLTPVKTNAILWAISANVTIPHNELLSFPGIENTTYKTATSKVIIGQGLDAQKVFHYAGVDPATGFYQAFDKKGNPTLFPNNIDDRTVNISNLTKYYGGIQNNINYRGVELDFTFQFVRQLGTRDMYFQNGLSTPGNFGQFSSTGNQLVDVLDRWQKPSDNVTVARFSTTNPVNGYNNIASSDAFYNYEPSFIRLKNISLSWDLPFKEIEKQKGQYVRIYFQGQNLATITKYRGLDPETKSSITLPPLRTMTFGMMVGF